MVGKKVYGSALGRAIRMTCDDITFWVDKQRIHITMMVKHTADLYPSFMEACSQLCKKLKDTRKQYEHEKELFDECFRHPWLCGESAGEDEIQWQRVSGIKADYIGGQQGKCLKGSLTEIVKQGGDTNQEEARSTGSPPKKQAVRRSSQKEQASGQKERASGWLSKLTR